MFHFVAQCLYRSIREQTRMETAVGQKISKVYLYLYFEKTYKHYANGSSFLRFTPVSQHLACLDHNI